VTLEIDMFGPTDFLAEVRRRETEGVPTGLADLRGAGITATAPEGHGTEYGFPIPTIVSPTEATAFVDARLAEGSDFVKIIYDHAPPEMPTLSRETLAALVAAAHARGKLAVVHVGTADDARDAVDVGADGLAHLFTDRPGDDAFVAAVLAHRTFVIPTLTVLARHCDRDAGGEVAADPHLAPFLDVAAFGLVDRGRIAKGARADLVLVEGDPTRDIRATRAIVAVWKLGVRVSRPVVATTP
jgi:cytosine/adenosine deaminase-related metal-dependent hydrolase